MYELELPYPPSLNTYYRNVKGRVLISATGREYRQSVCRICTAIKLPKTLGRIHLVVEAFPPDKRRRDIDNLLKAVQDSLQHGGAYNDDSQIDKITITRMAIVPVGKLIVKIEEI